MNQTPRQTLAPSEAGLSQAQARERLARDGPNELPAAGRRSQLRLLRDILAEPMFILLVSCGALYLVLGDPGEALMLLAFVFMIIGISYAQQSRTERSLVALRDLSSPRALVVRDGQATRVAGRELVCGDLVLLAEGDRVPADMVLIAAANLMLDESMLTGESVPVSKQALADKNANPDPANLVSSGTLVTQGTARACVVGTGTNSTLGRIGQILIGLNKDEDRTPIQVETAAIVKRVAQLGLLLACALAIAYWVSLGDALQGLLAGLTFAMAVLPEELPVVLTLFMGLGAWRLARDQVLVRHIPALEMLGATTVLCVDKTGTLTQNRMSVEQLWSEEDGWPCRVGAGAREPGTSEPVKAALPHLPEGLHSLLEFAVLASHRQAFDPMEKAITEAGHLLLAGTGHLHSEWTLLDDYALSPDMLAMTRVWQSPDCTERMIAAKGAPEAIMDLCHLGAQRQAEIARQVDQMALAGLRVLGVARANFAASAALPELQHAFEFSFLGLLGLQDPVRPEVPTAIAECRSAGIKVVMITGDHPATALSIATQAGLATDWPAITGAELDHLSDAALLQRLPHTTVFCRVQPEQKLRLVKALRERGEVVAMTGDGVNDAPALKAAHIGVAMGARGTDVAREAADLVLLDDDFSSLVSGVRHGRRVFANLRKTIAFIVAVHIPIVGLSLLPVLLGWPMLLMPAHVLFLQLIIDPACSLVFEAEPLEADGMRTPPRSASERLFEPGVLLRGSLQGGPLLLILLALYTLAVQDGGSHDAARTVTFAALVLVNLGLIHANRSWKLALWQPPPQDNVAMRWVSLGAPLLLTLVLAAPTTRRLFGFELPEPELALAGLGAVLLCLLWFEVINRLRRARQT